MQIKKMSNASQVYEFTQGMTNNACPSKPIEMNREAVLFIIRMVFSEMHELAATVTNNDTDATALLQQALNSIDRCKKFDYGTGTERIAAQADSMVDAWYYMLNTAAKHGVNLSTIFDLVHAANMDKRDPETKQFIRRESDGKVLKRPGWTEPDIVAEITRQLEHGAFN